MAKPSRRAWAEFERLIARIETTLAPAGAQVRCPDNHVADVDTGAMRNVDATVRFSDGRGARFVAFECRRRGRRQTVEWVESLVAKKASIGADRMIGVSSTGFARNAVRKAAARGVELRTARAMPTQDLSQWIAFPAVQLINVRWSIVQAVFQLQSPEPDDVLQITPPDGSPFNGDVPCIRVENEPQRISLNALMRRMNASFPEATPGVTQQHRFCINCVAETFVETNKGSKRVDAIALTCSYQYVANDGPLLDAVSYATPDAPIMDAAHFDVSHAIPGAVFAFHRDAATGRTSISIVFQPTPSGG